MSDTRLKWWQLAGAALLARLIALAVLLAAVKGDVHWIHVRWDLESFTDLAALITKGTQPWNPWATRVFPGWVLAVAPFYAVWPSPWVFILASIVVGCCLPVAYRGIAGDDAGALLLCTGTPAFLIGSITGMSEPLYLLMLCLALQGVAKNRPMAAGLWNGVTALVRPTAVFLAVGMGVNCVVNRKWRDLLMYAIPCGLGAALLFVYAGWMFGDALHHFHSYESLPNIGEAASTALGLKAGEGSHFGWPFVNLIKATMLPFTPLWKIAYVWLHVVALLAIVVLGLRRLRASSLHVVAAICALGTAAFILCTGPYWAFHAFDRYFTWALPAYLIILRSRLPASRCFAASWWAGCVLAAGARLTVY